MVTKILYCYPDVLGHPYSPLRLKGGMRRYSEI